MKSPEAVKIEKIIPASLLFLIKALPTLFPPTKLKRKSDRIRKSSKPSSRVAKKGNPITIGDARPFRIRYFR